MSFRKLMFAGVFAASVVLATAGCAWEDEVPQNNGGSRSGSTYVDPDFNNAKDADLAGEWGKNSGLNPYDDFGTVIVGLSFEPVYFKFDQSRIDSSEYSKLDNVAAYILQNPGTGVVVEGNCDSRGSDEYNRALGERRALEAKNYLLEKGVQEFRIRTVSYGEEKPAVQGSDESAYEKNRRDEFVGVKMKK